MKATRRDATMAAAEVASRKGKFGLILGTLGRQGNPRILDRLKVMCVPCPCSSMSEPPARRAWVTALRGCFAVTL